MYRIDYYAFECAEMFRRLLFIGIIPLVSSSSSRRAATEPLTAFCVFPDSKSQHCNENGQIDAEENGPKDKGVQLFVEARRDGQRSAVRKEHHIRSNLR